MLQEERRANARMRAGLLRQKAELNVVAPRAGSVVALADHMVPGRWVTPSEPIAVVHGADGMLILGLVSAGDVGRIRASEMATFIPNDILLPALNASITAVSTSNATTITQLELAQSHGGPVATRITAKGSVVPVEAQYSVYAAPLATPPAYPRYQPQMGVLLIEGEASSLPARLWRRVPERVARAVGPCRPTAR